MTADSSTAALAHSGDNGGGNSPSGRQSLPSPWAQVVRGGIEPDSISSSPTPSSAIADPVTVTVADTQPEGSDGGDGYNAGGVVKSAWSKPSANGVADVVTSPVMGAASWPALSESTRPGVKSVSIFSESSAKHSEDGSAVVSQVPVIPQPPPSKQSKQFTSNSHSNPNHNRQRSVRRGGSAGGASTGHSRPMPPTPPPLPPPFPFFDPYGNLVPPVPPVPVPPQPPFKNNNWSPRPVDQSFNRHPTQRPNNFGPRPINNGYGTRRDNRGPRSPAVRDVHVPHQMGPPPPPPPYGGFVRPPFMFPRPLRPYGAPIGYEMGASYVYYPTITQPPYRGGAPVSSSGPSGSSLHDDILKQIEYYFSDDNLVKDNFLRSHMDDEGWVSINLIAGFRRVQALTNDTQMLLSSLKDSSTVEIQGDKVRRRADWKKWIHILREITDNNSVEEASLQKLTLTNENASTNEEHALANGDVNNDDPCS